MTVLVKTPCASATLKFFGVSGTTWNDRTGRNVWDATLRRNGFAVRSRFSALSGATTVGAARAKIRKIAAKDKGIIAFVARVDGHVLVIDRDGNTAVDTDPRKKDKRKMFGFVAVWAK
tara:strand:+ start:6528 stop:6881 length:354 start_codon:yes stop_codon:yes gene_type:complete